MATYYFAYGADMDSVELDLQHDRRRRPRIRFVSSEPATLQGYRLVSDITSRVRRGGIFNVIPDPTASVSGAVYELRAGDTISVAVMKEGEIAKYELSLLPVKTHKGKVISALVLHAQPEKKQLKPTPDYLEIVIRAARKHKLPLEWIKYLQSLLK